MSKTIENIYNKIFHAKGREKEWEIWHNRTLLKIQAIKQQTLKIPEIFDPTEIKYYSWLSKEIIKMTKGEPKNILEIGGGTGALSLYLLRKIDINCTIVDISNIALEYASLLFGNHSNVCLINNNALELQFNDESFDFVHSVGLIEHYKDVVIKDMILEMKRVVKKRGYIYIAVPNFFSPDLINIWSRCDKGSERHITVNMLKKYVKSEKLKVISSGYCQFVTGYNIMPKSIEKLIGRCGFGFLNYILCQRY